MSATASGLHFVGVNYRKIGVGILESLVVALVIAPSIAEEIKRPENVKPLKIKQKYDSTSDMEKDNKTISWLQATQ